MAHIGNPDISNISTTNNITRHHHHSRFVLRAANTTIYQASFFYRIIKDWNDLPLNFYGIPTLSIFKSTINAHINGCNNTYNI